MDDLLNLPPRSGKPRSTARTSILDKGSSGLGALEDHLRLVHDFVDVAKLGWGTSIITPNLGEKIALFRRFNIEPCLGGTLFELFYMQRKVDQYAAWMKDLGITVAEISDGTLKIEPADKLRMIERFSRQFTVYSEVGSKDSSVTVSPAKWVKAIKAELSAGAAYVILEGRESGTAGIYRKTGEIRMELIDEIAESGISTDRLIIEAPRKAQQACLIKRLGPNVNMGNVPIADVLTVETLRRGLRADTLLHFFGGQSSTPPEMSSE